MAYLNIRQSKMKFLRLGEKVDLVTVGGIDKYIKDEVFRTMKVIYDNRPKR